MNTGYHTTSCYAHFLIKHLPLCHENLARVARPSLLRAGDAIHPVLQKGVVWFMRLGVATPLTTPVDCGCRFTQTHTIAYLRGLQTRV